MRKPTALSVCSALAVLLIKTPALAAVSVQEAARLGKDLTPMGAEQAGNAEGTIPAWEGGITQVPAGFQSGGHHPDPFPEDAVLFTISKDNMGEYVDKLSTGHQALLSQYGDTFKMNVYATRRSASYPDYVYEATRNNATSAQLTDDGNGVEGAIKSVPFPIPQNGLEVIWNHILRYRGNGGRRMVGQAPVTRSGTYNMVMLQDEFYAPYHLPDAVEAELNNVIILFKQRVLAPARLVGQIFLAHETMNQAKQHRMSWKYNPGERRVRRAPNVAFDNPGTATDGLRTSDQLDMYNGSPERYNWQLVGKKEIYVPYNAYKLDSNELSYADILRPLHMNPDALRYELHRVWVVDAVLKDGMRHIYKRRTFYIDEDSWQIVIVDQYDNRDQLWRVSEGHAMNYYEVPTLWTTVDVHYDLQSGRYITVGMNNEEAFGYDFSVGLSAKNFTPSSLRRDGRR